MLKCLEKSPYLFVKILSDDFEEKQQIEEDRIYHEQLKKEIEEKRIQRRQQRIRMFVKNAIAGLCGVCGVFLIMLFILLFRLIF